MATTITAYNQLSEMICNGALDLNDAGLTVMVALVTSSYTFSAAHDEWADASGNEVASGDGYTTGGEELTTKSLSQTGGVTTFDADDVTWSSLTKTFRRAVVYADGSIWGKTDPLLFSVLFDDTPGDVSVSGVDFQIIWNASGIMTV